MIKVLYIVLFFCLHGNAQMIGLASNQQSKFSTNAVIPEPTKTRFIIIGASIMTSTFFDPEAMKSTIESVYENANVTIHPHASPGETIGSYKGGSIPNITHTLSLYNNSNPDIKTYVILTLGGNDRTNSGVWSGLTETKKNQLSDDLDYMLDAIEAKGFTPILNDLGFRNYDGLAYEDEDYGVLPYNENLIRPKILARSPQFAFEDGQSFWQLYPLVYNNYETYLSNDNIHPSGTGYAAMRTAFVNTICKYIFTGIPPTKIEKE